MLTRLLLILAAVLLAACQSSPNAIPIALTDAPPSGSAAAQTGDPERGRALFNTLHPAASVTCSTCHRTDSEERLVGPGLLNVAARAQNRLSDGPAARYLYDSITNPSAYVVNGYPDIMPKNWGTIFSEQELADIIAYLLTLH
jgi:cytochrome c2